MTRTRIVATAILCAALAGCAAPAAVPGASGTVVSAAQTDLQNALALYGVAKGIAQVAAIANPAIAPGITATIGAVDPLVTQAQTVMGEATADASAIEALATQIKTQANSLTLTAAPAVKVVVGGAA